ncbi:probable transcription factor At4g00610 [Momordica charantia]|uniref:Probable transcription factor At4g00610 n=1 Tax=Momordica charantia TaxID=3673 RepID=A0A6J1E125_MOMCH|nr:probable transcription factor At4g00610 [Momordica charantia]
MSEYYSNSSEDERSSDTEYRVESESESDSEDEQRRRRRRRRHTKPKTKKKKAALSFKWREEDEVFVLKQLYEFSGKNATYSEEFYEFVKKKLGGQVSMHQMRNKIRGLRRKYLENDECNGLKFCGSGSQQHQRKVLAWSKRIWGAAENENENKNKNGGGTRSVEQYERGFVESLEEMEIEMDCLKPSCLEFLYKDWEIQTLMHVQLLSNKCKLDAKLTELCIQFLNTPTNTK